MHFLFEIALDDDHSLGLVPDIEPAPGEQADGDTIFHFVEDLPGSFDVLLLQSHHFQGYFYAAVVDLVHEMFQVLFPKLRSSFVHLLLLLSQPVRVNDVAVLLVYSPVLNLMLFTAVAGPFALCAHE